MIAAFAMSAIAFAEAPKGEEKAAAPEAAAMEKPADKMAEKSAAHKGKKMHKHKGHHADKAAKAEEAK